MQIHQLRHILLVCLLILSQVLSPALAKQMMNGSPAALTAATSGTLSAHAFHHLQPDSTPITSCHEETTTQSATSNTLVNDCCSDNCQCPTGSCSSAGLVFISMHSAVFTDSRFGFDTFTPLQRDLLPLLQPPRP